jgi:integrase
MSIRTRKWTTRKGEAREAYIVDYYDKAGKRHIETYEKLKDAKARENEIGVDIKDGVHVPRSTSITVAEAGTAWIEHCKVKRRNGKPLEPTTIAQYEQHVRLHITPNIGKRKLADLSVPDIDAFAIKLLKDGMEHAMQKKVMASLSALLKRACKAGNVNRNVADLWGRNDSEGGRHKKQVTPGVDMPTIPEIQQFIKALSGSPWRAFFITAIYTGMRASELRGLSWKNVTLGKDTGVVHVRERADIHHTIGSPKSETSTRDIPIGPVVVNALKEHLLKAKDKTGLVFPTKEAKKGDGNGNGERKGGKVQSHSNLRQRVLMPLMVKAGLTVPVLGEDDKPVMKVDKKGEPMLDDAGKPAPEVAAKYTGLHCFRHFYASWLINPVDRGGRGMPPKVVQQRLGHATLAMTMDTYGHLFPKDDDEHIAEAELALLG